LPNKVQNAGFVMQRLKSAYGVSLVCLGTSYRTLSLLMCYEIILIHRHAKFTRFSPFGLHVKYAQKKWDLVPQNYRLMKVRKKYKVCQETVWKNQLTNMKLPSYCRLESMYGDEHS